MELVGARSMFGASWNARTVAARYGLAARHGIRVALSSLREPGRRMPAPVQALTAFIASSIAPGISRAR
jgi:hypothetical protein